MAKNGTKSARGVIALANTCQLLAHENKQKKYGEYSDVEQATLIKSVSKLDDTFVSFTPLETPNQKSTILNFQTEPTTPINPSIGSTPMIL